VVDTQVVGSGSLAVSEMQSLILEIARALVDQTEAVTVEILNGEGATALRLHVAPSDIGKVIGKQGRTARSLRTILSAASMKLQHRFSLDIVEAGKLSATISNVSDRHERDAV
jgi:predicted RNA-binding protein YlqC (UPF0109 family)